MTKLQNISITVYIAYSLGAVLQFFDATMMAGLVAIALAGFIANQNRKNVKGTVFESHLRWMNRTLWIGALVIVPLAVVLTGVLIFVFTDAASLVHTLLGGDAHAILSTIKKYFSDNMVRIHVIAVITTAVPVIWTVHRCWRGYVLAHAEKPVENVTRWF